MKTATLVRELAIRWHNGQRQKWFVGLLEFVYGNLSSARYAQKKRRTIYNSFTAMAHQTRLSFVELSEIWHRLPKDMRKEFIDLAAELTRDAKEAEMKHNYLYSKVRRKKGLLGSRDRGMPISFEKAKQEVSIPNSELTMLWKEDNIKPFIRSLDASTKDFTASAASNVIYPEVRLAGEKCRYRAEERTRFMQTVLQPFRDSSRHFFDGNKTELASTVGIRYSEGASRRFSVFILLKKPWEMLGWEIDLARVQWETVSSVLGVSYDIPQKQRISIPNVFDGRELCIMNLLHSTTCGICPETFIYCQSTTCIIDDGHWYAIYTEEHVLRRAIDYVQVKSKASTQTERRHRERVPDLLGFEQAAQNPVAQAIGPIVDEFSTDIDNLNDENDEIDRVEMIHGDESEGELARRLVVSHANLRDVRRDMSTKIDNRYYSATVGEDRGIATTYWRTTQRNARMARYFEACEQLKKHNAATLHNSFSRAYTTAGFQDYIQQAVAWQQWHASWLHYSPVTVELGAQMLTPHNIEAINGALLGYAPGNRTGEIPGDDAPVRSGSDDIESTSSGAESTA